MWIGTSVVFLVQNFAKMTKHQKIEKKKLISNSPRIFFQCAANVSCGLNMTNEH
jgi:hypothetical protein